MLPNSDSSSIHLPNDWVVQANIKELMYQLSSLQYRCRDGANFSQRHRNNLCMHELYKLFDWEVYRAEQTQSISMSIVEQNLHQKHKDAHDKSTNTQHQLGLDGTIETLFPDPQYTIENTMPLCDTPRLDLYFTPSELITLSLLQISCVHNDPHADIYFV